MRNNLFSKHNAYIVLENDSEMRFYADCDLVDYYSIWTFLDARQYRVNKSFLNIFEHELMKKLLKKNKYNEKKFI